MAKPDDILDQDPPRQPRALVGERVLGSWVATAVAEEGPGRTVLRADNSGGTSEVMIHVVRLPEGDGAQQAGRELATARRLRHDRVVRLLLDGPLEGQRVLLALPSLGARNLATHLATHPPDLPTALLWLADMARGLQAIQQVGRAYGPLTPEHILIVPEVDRDVARLLPLWWAWRHGHNAAAAAPWILPGVAGGEGSAFTDVWSLGAIAWQVLTGRPLLDGDAVKAMHVGGAPPLPPRLADHLDGPVPDGLGELIAAMLSATPEARPTDLDWLANELETLAHTLDGRPGIAPPMVTGTPVPVGNQLRERSLVLPVLPPPSLTPVSTEREGVLHGTPSHRLRHGATEPTDEGPPIPPESDEDAPTETSGRLTSLEIPPSLMDQTLDVPVMAPSEPAADLPGRPSWPVTTVVIASLAGAAVLLTLYLTGLLGG